MITTIDERHWSIREGDPYLSFDPAQSVRREASGLPRWTCETNFLRPSIPWPAPCDEQLKNHRALSSCANNALHALHTRGLIIVLLAWHPQSDRPPVRRVGLPTLPGICGLHAALISHTQHHMRLSCLLLSPRKGIRHARGGI